MAPCTIATCRAESGGPWPRPGGVAVAGWLITLTAFSFQTSTMLVGSAAATDAAGINPAAPTSASTDRPASQRRTRIWP